jgi:hypothetical protein
MRNLFARIFTVTAAFFAWICTLAAGFATFMAVAIMVLLPIEAARNRAVYSVVEQYAQIVDAMPAAPRNAALHDVTASFKGIRIWPSRPGVCDGGAFDAPSDRFDLGFFGNGPEDNFALSWWHCYAYPSGKTNLQLSVWDYLAGAAGWQVAAYALIAAIAAIAGYAARSLGARGKPRSLKPWTKAAWFGAFMTILYMLFFFFDEADDVIADWEPTESVKWFAAVFEDTIYLISEPVLYVWNGVTFGNSPMLLTLFAFITWTMIGRVAGRWIATGRARLRAA